MDLLHVAPQLNLYDDSGPIWTWQPQVPPAKFVHDEDTRRDLAMDSIVLPKVVVGRDCQLKKCIIDRGCHIPDGSQIGIDPVADRKRFHVTASGITLVTRMMLGQDVSLLR